MLLSIVFVLRCLLVPSITIKKVLDIKFLIEAELLCSSELSHGIGLLFSKKRDTDQSSAIFPYKQAKSSPTMELDEECVNNSLIAGAIPPHTCLLNEGLERPADHLFLFVVMNQS
ncbi:Uncharacterized protein APZ42_013774 [Daphnia magna]|uniref:Uncharacterized protein n=1 Tax=Daphnia magna TaxID=35525 RepID=A0A162QIT3_9CRUS|nr:Uncharacterized protein APZ42_013774 [Daphnia magna]